MMHVTRDVERCLVIIMQACEASYGERFKDLGNMTT